MTACTKQGMDFLWRLITLALLALAPTPALTNVEINSSRFDLQVTRLASYLMDAHNQYSVNDFLQSDLRLQFTPTRTDVFREGYTNATLWLQLRIGNNLSQTETGYLFVDLPNLAEFTVYRETDVGFTQIDTNGNGTELVRGSVPHRAPATALYLRPGINDYLVKVRTNQYMNFTLFLADPVTFYQQQLRVSFFAGAIFCLLGVLCLFGLYGYGRWRENLYLYFFTLSGFIGVYIANCLGYLGFYWLPVTNLQPRLEIFSVHILLISLLLCSRALFRLPDRRKGLSQLCVATCVLLAISLVFCMTGDLQTNSKIAILLTVIVIPMNFFITATRAIDGVVAARWLVIPSLVTIALGSLTLHNVLAILAFATGTVWLLMGALVLHVTCAGIAIAASQMGHNRRSKKDRQKMALQSATRNAKTEFLGQLSHEIRTPMNGILGMTELLSDSQLSSAQQDYVKTISASGSNLLKILDDIMDYSKIETGQLELDITSFALGLTLSECIDSYQEDAQEKTIDLVTHLDRNLPFQVKGDPARLRQVLSNLIANGIQFTDQGSVHIHIAPDPDRKPHHIKITVSDTGVGISRELLADLFIHDDNNTQPFGQHRMGLHICQRLVKLMGGEMGANSQLNHGSTFWFSIPLEPDVGSQEEMVFAEHLHGMRLLVVDDNSSCRLVLQQQANNWGMDTRVAANGKQALAMLHNQAVIHEPFDVIILDQEMPGMSGMELAAKIKEDKLINNDPLVLMLTGLSTGPNNSAASNAGIRRVISKPITGSLLRATLLEELTNLRRIRTDHPSLGDKTTVLPPMKILVAEDHHLSQKVINGMLTRLGVISTMVDDGASAVEAIKHNRYDLILMDCEMPILSGFDAAREIREWEQSNEQHSVPIIALTAHIMDEHKEHSLQCGMNAHLSKPIELIELRDVLLEYCNTEETSGPHPIFNPTESSDSIQI